MTAPRAQVRPKSVPSFMSVVSDVARFYGFAPVRDFDSCLETATLRPDEATLGFYAAPAPARAPLPVPARELREMGFVIAGPQGSMGEIVLIKVLAAIATEYGAGVTRVRVNAIGDKDSKLRFTRELSSYLRRQAEKLDESCRQKICENPLSPYLCGSSACREVLQEGPHAVNFLSEKSRVHFREMLEHLDRLALPYELDDMLISDERDAQSAFALDIEDEGSIIVCALGGRLECARRHVNRKEMELSPARLFFRPKGPLQKKRMAPVRPARLYFVQLGLRARLEGLNMLEALYRARIPVLQSFDSSRLAPQLQAAREAHVTHLIIMGQREALDRTVIVRSVADSAQEIVPHRELTRYLKNLSE